MADFFNQRPNILARPAEKSSARAGDTNCNDCRAGIVWGRNHSLRPLPSPTRLGIFSLIAESGQTNGLTRVCSTYVGHLVWCGSWLSSEEKSKFF
jgi:hypothetical protein